MVVNYFNIISIIVEPAKAKSPLIINPDAVLTFSVAFKQFQMVAGRRSKVIQVFGLMQIHQFTPCCPFNIGKTRYFNVLEQDFRIFAAKCPYHEGKSITESVICQALYVGFVYPFTEYQPVVLFVLQ